MDDETKQKADLLENRLSRRGFLKASGALIVTGMAGVTGQEQPPHHVTPGPPLAPATPVVGQYPGEPHAEVPFAPAAPPEPGVLRFFTLREARTVDAVTARIIPGDEGDPGAREAGVVNFIDFMLSRADGFNEPVYRNPPYAEPFEGDEPPEAEGYRVIWVPKDELERYGYQLALTPREMYRSGLVALDRYASEEKGSAFAELSEDEQDEILEAMGEGEAFDDPPADEFFEMLRNHTIQGMFADPIYGGNRDMVGWRLLDYPGAQRAYTFNDMRTEGHDRAPRSLAELPHVHPGQPANEHVRLPVFGSDPDTRRESR
jgi:gluconate 2-dehydrogenase gamma chain